MKKIMVFASLVILSVFMITTSSVRVDAGAGLCYNCGSGSSCDQCPSGSGNDTFDDRKACEKKGCKVTGTSSCSTAANVKKC